jgi:hypothetical protein
MSLFKMKHYNPLETSEDVSGFKEEKHGEEKSDYDKDGNRIIAIDGKRMYDKDGNRIISIDGKRMYDKDGNPVEYSDGRRIYDVNGKRIIHIDVDSDGDETASSEGDEGDEGDVKKPATKVSHYANGSSDWRNFRKRRNFRRRLGIH